MTINDSEPAKSFFMAHKNGSVEDLGNKPPKGLGSTRKEELVVVITLKMSNDKRILRIAILRRPETIQDAGSVARNLLRTRMVQSAVIGKFVGRDAKKRKIFKETVLLRKN